MLPPVTQNAVRQYFAMHKSGTTKMIRAFVRKNGAPDNSLHYAIDRLLSLGEIVAEHSIESKKVFTYTCTDLLGKDGLKPTLKQKLFISEREHKPAPEGVLILQNIFIPKHTAVRLRDEA